VGKRPLIICATTAAIAAASNCRHTSVGSTVQAALQPVSQLPASVSRWSLGRRCLHAVIALLLSGCGEATEALHVAAAAPAPAPPTLEKEIRDLGSFRIRNMHERGGRVFLIQNQIDPKRNVTASLHVLDLDGKRERTLRAPYQGDLFLPTRSGYVASAMNPYRSMDGINCTVLVWDRAGKLLAQRVKSWIDVYDESTERMLVHEDMKRRAIYQISESGSLTRSGLWNGEYHANVVIFRLSDLSGTSFQPMPRQDVGHVSRYALVEQGGGQLRVLRDGQSFRTIEAGDALGDVYRWDTSEGDNSLPQWSKNGRAAILGETLVFLARRSARELELQTWNLQSGESLSRQPLANDAGEVSWNLLVRPRGDRFVFAAYASSYRAARSTAYIGVVGAKGRTVETVSPLPNGLRFSANAVFLVDWVLSRGRPVTELVWDGVVERPNSWQETPDGHLFTLRRPGPVGPAENIEVACYDLASKQRLWSKIVCRSASVPSLLVTSDRRLWISAKEALYIYGLGGAK
jgi:hypothetical protein